MPPTRPLFRHSRTLPIALTLLPAAALLSLNCGIIALPVTAPMVVVQNTRQLKFTFDITDDRGNPLPDVNIQITRHAARVGFFLFEADHEKPDDPRTITGPFTYSTFGNMAVEVACTKPGYDPATFLFTDQDHLELPPKFLINYRPITGAPINIKKSPLSHLVLAKTPRPDQTIRPAPNSE